jgi:hypothetical protein
MFGTRRATSALVAALLAIVSGCTAFSDPMHREDDFIESVRTFTQYVRWGNFNGASLFVVDELKEDFLDLAPQLTDVRFTDYEILRKDLNEDRTAATVDVVLTGYRLSSPISRTVRLRQEWTRTEGSSWRVRIELAPMREALGLAAQ